MALISLTEWAKREGITDRAARQKASEGRLKTAQKIARNWVIDESEQNADYRRREMTTLEIAKLLKDMTDDEMYGADQYPQITHMAGTSRESTDGCIYFLAEADDEEIIYEEVTPDVSAEDYDWSADKDALTELYIQVRDAARIIYEYETQGYVMPQDWQIKEAAKEMSGQEPYARRLYYDMSDGDLWVSVFPSLQNWNEYNSDTIIEIMAMSDFDRYGLSWQDLKEQIDQTGWIAAEGLKIEQELMDYEALVDEEDED